MEAVNAAIDAIGTAIAIGGACAFVGFVFHCLRTYSRRRDMRGLK